MFDTTATVIADSIAPLIADSFAGGGGASCGIAAALGRGPDVAINHDATALSMHQANHPATRHLTSNVWQVDPADLVTRGQATGLAWFSPDCKHHSRAKGAKPVQKNIRDLAWVAVMWAQRVRPDVIFLENVEEFAEWGPLTSDDRPDIRRKGETFAAFTAQLRKLGYRIDHRSLSACDYGAPTIRKRLFMIARRDGRPIVWPIPTHGAPDSVEVQTGLRQPWRTAADIIDWTLPCPSIFDTSEQIRAKHGIRAVRPLAENTLARIAAGIRKFVVDAPQPFIAPCVASAAPHPRAAAFMAQHNTGVIGRAMDAPLSTITATGAQQALVVAHMMNLHGSARSAHPMTEPLTTICAGGGHAALVSAFLVKYYGQGIGHGAGEPLHTLTVRDRFGLVTVAIDGETYAIADIGMRMLTPREQFRAQGFPDSYQIDRGHDGRPLTRAEQTRMCGNSVCPPVAEALVRANCQHLMREETPNG